MAYKTQAVCGQTICACFDDKVGELNLELVKVGSDEGNHYQIWLEDMGDDGRVLLKLHIQEAIELKGVIDSLVYSAHEDRHESITNKEGDTK